MGLKKLFRKIGEWEIQELVAASLFLQMILLFSGGRRKRTTHWFLRLVLWLAYLLADYVAIYALGHLSQKDKLLPEDEKMMHLHVFWAPFLILHLGGQDTVTAFAVEDNELWLRHLLSLVSQVFLAGYVYRKSHPAGVRLMRPAIVMFVAGAVKYIERTLALRAASMGCLRSSMLTPPDPGPDYAKFVEECQSRRDAGLVAEIVNVPERPPDDDGDAHVEAASSWGYGDLVYHAHRFHRTFRRLFVDLILSFQDRTDSLAFFRRLDMDRAFKVVEVELMLMYECLHTKALVIHHRWLGLGLRFYTLSSAVVSLVLFLRAAGDIERYEHSAVDVVICYVLLAGAILAELCALVLVIVSPWTYAYLRAMTGGGRLRRASSSAVLWFMSHRPFYPEKRPLWSNKVSQYNLIQYCLKDKPGLGKTTMEWLEWKHNLGAKTLWDYLLYTDDVAVTRQLKRFVLEQIRSKSRSVTDPKNYRKLGEHRGQWALQRRGLYHELGWSVDCEFDESILLWHIATDLCFYGSYSAAGTGDEERCCGCCSSCGCPLSRCLRLCFRCCCSCSGSGPPDSDGLHGQDQDPRNLATMSREISNYMVFLLVMLPFMMPAGIGQIRFSDTCAEAKNFFRRDGEAKDAEACAKELRDVDTSIAEPRDVKGDRSNSVLFQACKLAGELRKLGDEATRWSLIAGVWAEMLCYAAGKCRGASHSRQLSQGGQLLTVVWLLMAHFGVGEQYRVESGHVRAKLIVVD